MSVVVYGFADAEASGLPERGLDERPLRIVAEDEVAAVVSDHDAPRLDCSGANLWDYERVMERLMACRTIVPARFGSVLVDERQTLELIRDRHDELRLGLARLRGAVEIGARVRWRGGVAVSEPAEASSPGAAYMARRVALHRRARDLAHRLDPLAELARDVRRRLDEDKEFPVSDAYLVPREQVGKFAEAVKELDERDPEIELVCTGPWPPFSFARAIDLTENAGGSG